MGVLYWEKEKYYPPEEKKKELIERYGKEFVEKKYREYSEGKVRGPEGGKDWINPENATKDLIEIKQVFDEIGQKFWLIGGVLLGHYRNKDYLFWEDDLDLGTVIDIPDESKHEEFLLEKLEPFHSAGFEIHISKPKLYAGCIVRLIKRERTDLMIWEEYKGEYIFSWSPYYLYYPKKMFENMDTLEIGGVKFNIPTPVEEFLFLKFGDWEKIDAPINEKAKKFTKEEFYEMYDRKVSWRKGTPHQVLTDRMKKYYNSIIYIAGCFDLFHIGHVTALHKASLLGHKLIVGVGTDEYVRKFKGVGRPFQPYWQRKAMVESLGCVWKVVSHSPEYDIEVYDKEGITTLCISDDFSDTEEHRIRLREAKKKGIEIVVIPRMKGVSTTKIVESCGKYKGISKEVGRKILRPGDMVL